MFRIRKRAHLRREMGTVLEARARRAVYNFVRRSTSLLPSLFLISLDSTLPFFTPVPTRVSLEPSADRGHAASSLVYDRTECEGLRECSGAFRETC